MRRMRRRTGFAVICIFAGIISTSRLLPAAEKTAQTAATPGKQTPEAGKPALPDFSQGLLDREAALKSAAEVTRDRYPNADDVLVDDHVWVRYNADGTYVTWDDWYVKVLTEKGRQSLRVLSLYFTIPYSLPEDIAAKLIEIIKPNNKVIKIDVAQQSQIMINRGQMRANIFNPNSKILKINVPGIEVGDVIHYIVYRRERHPRFRKVWNDVQIFESTNPIKHYIYEIFGPRELPLKRIVLKDRIKGTVVHATEEKDGMMHYRWEASNVPRMFREPKMPSLANVVQRLLVSTAPDWKTISRWYWSISEPHFKVTPEIKAKVAQLVKGKKGRDERIRAIFNFVSQKVRYLGITKEDTAPGYEPHDVADTFRNRAGVCRDKAALLAVMLREAGFRAFPVLIHAGDKRDPDVPMPWFNHAISCIQNQDGSYLLMDSTDENTRQLLPPYLGDKSYLVARPEGETLLTSPVIPATENLMRIETRGRVSASGDLEARSTLHFDGINDNGYRGWFSRTKPDERRRFFESVVKAVVPGARLTGFDLEPHNMMDTSRPMLARIDFIAKKVMLAGNGVEMLPLPSFGTRIGFASFLLRGASLEKRRYPFKTGIACGVRESLELELAPELGRIVSMPAYSTVNSPALTWKRTLERRGGKLIGVGEFLLKVVQFSPGQYTVLKNTLKVMEYDSRKMPILHAPARHGGKTGTRTTSGALAGADAVTVSEVVKYDLTDTRNWTVERTIKRRILTYAGKKRYAEIKVDYNPAWEDVDLLGGTVITGKGRTLKVDPGQVNRMDAAWVGSARRYPAGKTMVVNLPGVDLGSVIEYTIRKRCRDKPFFSMREYFRAFDPIRHKTVQIRLPRRIRLRVKTLPGSTPGQDGPGNTIESSQHEDRGFIIHQWSVRNAGPITRERSLPPLYAFVPTVMASTGNWRQYARTVQRALTRAAMGQSRSAARAGEIAGNLENPGDRIRAIRDFVAREIRNAGPGLNRVHLSAVTPADQTLEQGYGNSADRAVLLYAMLRSLRLRPQILLSSWSPMVPALQEPLREIPDMSLFNGALVRVRCNREYAYLGDTSQYAALGATPHDGRLALLANGRMEPVTAMTDCSDRESLHLLVELDNRGNAVITRTRMLYGNVYGARKKLFAQLPPEERRRKFQAMVADMSQAARPVGELVTDFTGYPGRERFKVSWERFAVIDNDFMYFNLPESLAGLFRFWSDTRKNPYYRSRPRKVDIRIEVALPEAFPRAVLLPPEIDWQGPAGTGRVKVESRLSSQDAERVRLRMDLHADLNPAVVPPGQYARLMEIMRRLTHPGARTVLLGKKK